jgi:VWFA-related protein
VILIADRMGQLYGGFNVGDSDMNKLAGDTGGRVINVGNNGKKLEEAFQQITDELRTQYLLSYTPTNPKSDGTYRKLEVDCGKNVKLDARKGYYAIASADTE